MLGPLQSHGIRELSETCKPRRLQPRGPSPARAVSASPSRACARFWVGTFPTPGRNGATAMGMQHPRAFKNASRFSSGEAVPFFRARILRIFRIVGAPGVAAFFGVRPTDSPPRFRNRSTEPVQRCGDATTRGIRTGLRGTAGILEERNGWTKRREGCASSTPWS